MIWNEIYNLAYDLPQIIFSSSSIWIGSYKYVIVNIYWEYLLEFIFTCHRYLRSRLRLKSHPDIITSFHHRIRDQNRVDGKLNKEIFAFICNATKTYRDETQNLLRDPRVHCHHSIIEAIEVHWWFTNMNTPDDGDHCEN